MIWFCHQQIKRLVENLGTCRTNDRNIDGEIEIERFPKIDDKKPFAIQTLSLREQVVNKFDMNVM